MGFTENPLGNEEFNLILNTNVFTSKVTNRLELKGNNVNTKTCY
jgi:hypothetical protein